MSANFNKQGIAGGTRTPPPSHAKSLLGKRSPGSSGLPSNHPSSDLAQKRAKLEGDITSSSSNEQARQQATTDSSSVFN